MACGCATRMRSILSRTGYELDDDSIWRKEGRQDFPDDRIEEDHFRVLIESMSAEMFGLRAANFMRRIGGTSRP